VIAKPCVSETLDNNMLIKDLPLNTVPIMVHGSSASLENMRHMNSAYKMQTLPIKIKI
jgi:hypothetical protein